jgi:hypothetical protein
VGKVAIKTRSVGDFWVKHFRYNAKQAQIPLASTAMATGLERREAVMIMGTKRTRVWWAIIWAPF